MDVAQKRGIFNLLEKSKACGKTINVLDFSDGLLEFCRTNRGVITQQSRQNQGYRGIVVRGIKFNYNSSKLKKDVIVITRQRLTLAEF